MYQRIVVGTDGSERAGTAVEHAATLAKQFGSTLILVQGVGSAVVVAPAFGAVEPVAAATIVDAARNEVDLLADRLRARGLSVETYVTTTDGVSALCGAAKEHDAQLIVVGNRGMTGARRLLGSVPNSVAHHAPCAVLIVPTD